MHVLIREDYDKMSNKAAEIVAECIHRKPDCVLGFATGGTPEGMYDELVRMHQDQGLDFSQVVTFNLDEYAGLNPDHHESYRFYMDERLFRHVNIDLRNTHVPNGSAANLNAECVRYEGMIKDAGGIDLQVLGIGVNAHLAFNEPVVSSFASRTRVVTLSEETREANKRFFGSIEEVPRAAISMGLGTILESRRCLLLVSGLNKAKAAHQAIEGPITTMVPASVLQLHPDATAVLDYDAADLLELRGFYEQTEKPPAEVCSI